MIVPDDKRCGMTAIGGGYSKLRRCIKPAGHPFRTCGDFQLEGCDFGPPDYERPKGVLIPGDNHVCRQCGGGHWPEDKA